MVNEVMAEAGTNMSIGCPGVTRNTFVVQLEWHCRGQCGEDRLATYSSPGINLGTAAADAEAAGYDGHKEAKLLKYVKDQETTVLTGNKRISLGQDMFALEFDPVTSLDKGTYVCLINNRPTPDAVIRLVVLGELFFGHFTPPSKASLFKNALF